MESASDLKTNRETRRGISIRFKDEPRDKMWASARVAEQTDDEDEHHAKGWKTGESEQRTCERARELKALVNELYKGTREYRRSVSEMYKGTRKLKG